MKTMSVTVGGEPLSFEVHGETIVGEDKVLLAEDDNLIAGTPFEKSGYGVFPFLSADLYARIKEGITALVASYLEGAGVKDLQGFTLERYHHFATADDHHRFVVAKIQKGIPMSFFPIDVAIVERRLSEICGVALTTNTRSGDHTFSVRIVRPMRLADNNPPHRDVWLDHLRNAVNTYVPLAGSNERSALPLIPGSHLWKESEIERTAAGAQINGLGYTVPSVVGSRHGMDMIRPNPKANEVMVFSPYAVHGGGYNLNQETTRASLEMRFWRK